jgi:hypothetical protein
MCCPTVVISAIVSTVVAQLVVLRWCLAVVDVVFSSFYDYFFVFIVSTAVSVRVLPGYLAYWSCYASRVVGTATRLA